MLNQRLDAITKFKVLDLIDPRPIIKLDRNPNLKFNKEALTTFLKTNPSFEFGKVKDESMFLVWDDFVEKDLALACRQEAAELVKDGKLRDAGFGK